MAASKPFKDAFGKKPTEKKAPTAKPKPVARRVPGPPVKDPNEMGEGQTLKKGRPVENAGSQRMQAGRTLTEAMGQPLLPTAVDFYKKKAKKK